MWYEVYWHRQVKAWMLIEGTEDGYRFTKIYLNTFTAYLSAKTHGYKFCKNRK